MFVCVADLATGNWNCTAVIKDEVVDELSLDLEHLDDRKDWIADTSADGALDTNAHSPVDLLKPASAKKKHRQRCFTCEFCRKLFRSTSDLNKHVRYHTQVKPYACTLCETFFSQSSGFYEHMRRCHPGMPYFTNSVRDSVPSDSAK